MILTPNIRVLGDLFILLSKWEVSTVAWFGYRIQIADCTEDAAQDPTDRFRSLGGYYFGQCTLTPQSPLKGQSNPFWVTVTFRAAFWVKKINLKFHVFVWVVNMNFFYIVQHSWLLGLGIFLLMTWRPSHSWKIL